MGYRQEFPQELVQIQKEEWTRRRREILPSLVSEVISFEITFFHVQSGLLLFNPLLQAVIESTFGLSLVCKNLGIDLGTMTWLDSLIVLLSNMLSAHVCCLSTIHNVNNPVSIRAQPKASTAEQTRNYYREGKNKRFGLRHFVTLDFDYKTEVERSLQRRPSRFWSALFALHEGFEHISYEALKTSH